MVVSISLLRRHKIGDPVDHCSCFGTCQCRQDLAALDDRKGGESVYITEAGCIFINGLIDDVEREARREGGTDQGIFIKEGAGCTIVFGEIDEPWTFVIGGIDHG